VLADDLDAALTGIPNDLGGLALGRIEVKSYAAN